MTRSGPLGPSWPVPVPFIIVTEPRRGSALPAAQRTRAELLVQNLANSETKRTPEGGPYRRRDAVFESAPETSPFSAVFQSEMTNGVTGVEVADVTEDTSEGAKRYQPGHPDADKDGYVAFPNVNPAEASPVSEAPVRAVLDLVRPRLVIEIEIEGARELLGPAAGGDGDPRGSAEKRAETGARLQRVLGAQSDIFPAARAS